MKILNINYRVLTCVSALILLSACSSTGVKDYFSLEDTNEATTPAQQVATVSEISQDIDDVQAATDGKPTTLFGSLKKSFIDGWNMDIVTVNGFDFGTVSLMRGKFVVDLATKKMSPNRARKTCERVTSSEYYAQIREYGNTIEVNLLRQNGGNQYSFCTNAISSGNFEVIGVVRRDEDGSEMILDVFSEDGDLIVKL